MKPTHWFETRCSRLARLAVLLLVPCASLIPGPAATARPPETDRLLFQVTPEQWQHAIRTWKLYPTRSWTARAGTLTNTRRGVKFCDNEGGQVGCSYQSLIVASYHIPTTSYALGARMRFQGRFCCHTRGIALLLPRTSAGPIPWLFADENGIWGRCPVTPPVLVGTSPSPISPCGLPVSPPVQPIWSYHDDGNWHLYRLEVRGKRYHLLIDGREMEGVRDPRPPVGPGARFGFYVVMPNWGNHVWIRTVTITALSSAPAR